MQHSRHDGTRSFDACPCRRKWTSATARPSHEARQCGSQELAPSAKSACTEPQMHSLCAVARRALAIAEPEQTSAVKEGRASWRCPDPYAAHIAARLRKWRSRGARGRTSAVGHISGSWLGWRPPASPPRSPRRRRGSDAATASVRLHRRAAGPGRSPARALRAGEDGRAKVAVHRIGGAGRAPLGARVAEHVFQVDVRYGVSRRPLFAQGVHHDARRLPSRL